MIYERHHILSSYSAIGNNCFGPTLRFIGFAGTPSTISPSDISLITEYSFSIITLAPILSLCLMVQFSPHQQASPIFVLPPL